MRVNFQTGFVAEAPLRLHELFFIVIAGMAAKTVNAKLTAEIVKGAAGKLVLRYKLANQSNDELCVLNWLYQTDVTGKRKLDHDLAFVLFDGNDTVHITRSFIPIPPGLKVEYVDLPYITILAPGKAMEGRVVLELPVREFYPYMKFVGKDTIERERARIYFSLGVFVKTPDVALRRPKDSNEGIFAALFEDVASRQVLLKSDTIDAKVKTLIDRKLII